MSCFSTNNVFKCVTKMDMVKMLFWISNFRNLTLFILTFDTFCHFNLKPDNSRSEVRDRSSRTAWHAQWLERCKNTSGWRPWWQELLLLKFSIYSSETLLNSHVRPCNFRCETQWRQEPHVCTVKSVSLDEFCRFYFSLFKTNFRSFNSNKKMPGIFDSCQL